MLKLYIEVSADGVFSTTVYCFDGVRIKLLGPLMSRLQLQRGSVTNVAADNFSACVTSATSDQRSWPIYSQIQYNATAPHQISALSLKSVLNLSMHLVRANSGRQKTSAPILQHVCAGACYIVFYVDGLPLVQHSRPTDGCEP
jgi:hypothetical protein